MQFFSQGKEDVASLALAAAMRSVKMCEQHLSAHDSREHEVRRGSWSLVTLSTTCAVC